MCAIRPMRFDEGAFLHALWERSVRATHTFLSEEDIAFYSPLVRRALETELAVLVVCDAEKVLGFMALERTSRPVKIEALFIDPAEFRKGLGTRLVRHVLELYGPVLLDVNEQNPGALVFYASLGFRETGRSPRDGAGKPFPLIHMRHEGPQEFRL